MTTFEIVRGVEGDCLVLDGTRICGPKPWGGGLIIKTFRTDGIYEVIDKDEYRKLVDDNAKLRELVHVLLQCRVEGDDICAKCNYRSPLHGGCMADVKADELGVEVNG